MKLTQLNIVSWIFYVQLLVSSYIASILVINGWEGNHAVSIVRDNSRFCGWLSVQYTMIAMPLGMLFINYLYGYESNRKLFLSYIKAPIVTLISQKDSFLKYPLYALSIVCLLSVAYTFVSIKTIPIFSVFQGYDAQELLMLRQYAHKGYEGSSFIRNTLGLMLTPIISYIAFAYWRMTKSSAHFIWFFCMFILSLFMLTYDLSKSPIVFYLLGFIFLNVLMKGGVKKSTLAIFIVLSLFLLALAIYLISRIVDTQAIFLAMRGRIFLSQAASTYFAFEYFPAINEFLGVSSLSSLLFLPFGMETTERSARIIMTIFNPSGIEAGTAGVMNSLFVAEAWANFGWCGVVIAPFYVGMFIQIIYMSFLSYKKTPIMIGLLAYLSYKLPITGGFNDFIYPTMLMNLFFIFISLYVAALILKGIKRHRHANHISSPGTT